MSKRERTQDTSFSLPIRLQGFLLLCLSCVLLLGLVSFTEKHPERNFLGLIGHTFSWGLTYLFGAASFLLPLYFGIWAVRLLLKKSFSEPRLKGLYFGVFLVSCAVLLSMLEESKPLGGIPFQWIYSGPSPCALSNLLGEVGTFFIFASLGAASLFLLTELKYAHLKAASLWLRTRMPVREEKPKLPPAPKPSKRPFKKPQEDIEPLFAREHPLTTVTFSAPIKKKPRPIPVPKVGPGEFVLPPSSLLTEVKPTDQSELKNDLKRQAEMLEETLLSFGIEAKVGNIHCGPTITSFEVHPAVGVKVQKIKALENDIALNLQAHSIRIIAPIPGKGAVGIEVPNPKPQEVSFRELLESYQEGTRKGFIPLLLGKAVNGEEIWTDLTKMPHLIIAGATGSGKSVCINTIVMSILATARPDEIKLVMVDPKKVELTSYSRLPHMLAPVITEPGEACAALGWLVKEMERRYEIFRQLGIRNLHSFNNRKRNQEVEESLDLDVPEKLPFIVVIIDELADLMMVSSSDIETPIARIAQMARAVGIHLILATQRPSREVITGLIKANFPTRIAFKVSSRVNSQIILDENGAECLLGNGDMLFMPPGTSTLVRAQGAFLRDEDIHRVIDYICQQAGANYLIPSFTGFDKEMGSFGGEGNDPLFLEAKKLVLETGNASTTFLQRKLKVGYARAASLMDELEGSGIIGPQEGARPRKIFYPQNET